MAGCTECVGGWRQVGDAYPAKHAPEPDPLALAGLPPDVAGLLAERLRQRRAVLADSWYPCKACNGQLFYRWVGGHLDPAHSMAGCADCQGLLPRRRRQAQPSPAMAGLADTRRDLQDF